MIYKKITLIPGQRVFFSSDFHYGHKNICRGTTQWELSEHGGENSVRDFDTLEEMNSTIVNGINNIVGQDDWLVCLGDWSFGGRDNIWKFRKRIVCKNIIHILGNHDHPIANNIQLPNCKVRVGTGLIVDKEHPGVDFSEVNAQYLFKEVYSYLELTVSHSSGEKTTYNLFHFPITIWNKAHHDRIHLYGHVHGGYTAPDRSLDVGVDNAFKLFGEYRPFSERDIQKYMKTRSYKQQSHHNKNTN
jgi:calcineurin-like phosphoesterase family protein